MNIWPSRETDSAALPRSASVERAKIYGERRTGTTFVTDLIHRNFTVPLLFGMPGRAHRAEREKLMEGLAHEPIAVRRVVLDRIGEQENRCSISDTLGWKHMFPPLALLQSMPEFVDSTLFIVTVKHPVFWALSFYRAPIDVIYKFRRQDFSQFLRQPFVPTLRDGMEAPFYASVVEFYADKVEGYRKLAAMVPHFELVRYEDLLTDVPGFVDLLTEKYRLVRQSGETSLRETSTNHREGTFDSYREEYRLDRVREQVSSDDYDFIVQRFGRERLDWLGYDL